jgi:hypothetical protein
VKNKEKPIIFNTEMVKAILEDRKTQTRRVDGLKDINNSPNCFNDPVKSSNTANDWAFHFYDGEKLKGINYLKCPYQIGMKLYVRETWTDPTPDQSGYPIMYLADMPMHWDKSQEGGSVTLYAKNYKWRPSIHMPKDYARLFLEITNIRAERIRDISVKDIFAEGIKINKHNIASDECFISKWINLWDPIYEKQNYGWVNNPWVWVIEFKRCT